MKKDCAVAVYLDNDKESLREIFWLYRSWKYSGSNNRSDLVVFYNPSIDKSILPNDDDIIFVPLAPIYETDKLWKDYRRINNTWFLTTPESEIVNNYEYTFRTDTDCFLTKNFVNLRPRLATFGVNLYETRNSIVSDKIRNICRKYGIAQYHMNVDCHVIAYSYNIREYAKLQYQIARKLKLEEFTDGHGEWPGWYEYIINMYSAGIAANSYYGMGYNLGGLSSMSMSDDPIGSTDYCIHAWHTDQNFSKLKWRKGYYDVLDFDALDDNIINSYCAKMAGKRDNGI